MKWTNIILTTCFILLGYGQTDEPKSKEAQTSTQSSLPNTYYLAASLQGRNTGLMFGYAPKGIEIGLEFYIRNKISETDEEKNYTYDQIDNTLIETSNYQKDIMYDYTIDYHATLYVNKKIFSKQSNNNNFALYTGIQYYKKNNSYKYSYSSASTSGRTQKVEYESIYVTDTPAIILGAKNEYRILKHISFEFDYFIEIGYSMSQRTQKNWIYDEDDILESYSQDLEKESDIYIELDSPRIIIKYFF